MEPLTKIVVVGGGTAGWIAASILINQLKTTPCRVELVESEEIGTIGVGESTIPPFLELLASLKIDERDFIQKTQASFKLGIQFTDWRVKGESYFHPFGSITAGMDEYTFYQSWLRCQHRGEHVGLQEFSPSSIMAKHGRFFLPQNATRTPVGEARYALHLDASLVARYLRGYAEALGVVRTEGKVTQVIKLADDRIERIILHSGVEIDADFFIDCTGFRALLIEKNLNVNYCDWTHFLPCDRAVAVQTENRGETTPYTRATARDHGWTWRIPLQYRTGNGYVYASQFCSDDEAVATLLDVVEGELLTEPRVIPFRTGVRESVWKGNCLSVGLASGFIEPLESTAIHLVVRGMVHFMRHFPDKACDPALIREYNRRITMDYEEIRDFIVLHYCLTEREDTPFWRWCKNMEWPASLKGMTDYFRIQGGLPEIIEPLFTPVSWRSVCEGMGLRPQKYSPLVEEFDYESTLAHMRAYLNAAEAFIKTLPSHDQFIQQNCPAPLLKIA